MVESILRGVYLRLLKTYHFHQIKFGNFSDFKAFSGDVDGFALTGRFQKLKKHGWVYFSLYALLTDSLFTFDAHTSPSEFVNVSFFPYGNSVHRVENLTNG